MRRYVVSALAAAASLGFVSSASAADMPVKAPVMAVPAAFSWAGPYVGLNAGYAWGRSTQTDVTGYNLINSTYSYNPDGFQGGLHAGYNWQVNQFVFGAEVELGYLGINKSAQYPPYVGVRTAADSVANTSSGWFGVLAARAGFAVNRTLLFVKGGGILSGIKNSFTDTDPFGLTLVSGTSTGDRTGWTVGGGLEHAFTNNLAARIEYAHYDFGTASHTATASNAATYTFRHSLTADSVRVGLTYLIR